MKIDVGKGEQEAVFSVYTLMLYEQEFGGDLIQDMITNAIFPSEEGGEIVFKQSFYVLLMKIVWAALKAGNDKVPAFKKWARETSGFNANEMSTGITEALTDAFFRTGAKGSK